MKIKKLSILIVVIVVGLMLLMQLLSFVNFRIWGNNQADVLFENIATDITDRINEEISIVENVAFNISVDKTVQDNIFRYGVRERANDVENLQNVLASYSLNTKSIGYVGIVLDGETICFATTRHIIGEGVYSLAEEIVGEYKTMSDQKAIVATYVHADKAYFVCMNKIFSLNIIDANENKDSYVMVVFEPTNLIAESKNNSSAKIQKVITDEKNTVITSNCGLKTGEKYSFNGGNKMISKTVPLNRIGCNMNISVPVYEVLDVTKPSGVFVVLIVVFAIAVFIFLMMTLVNKILKSILEIEKGANIIMGGDYEYRFDNPGENEISNIKYAMNGILDAVEKSNEERLSVTQKLFEVTLLQKQAEISHMQNQISPHFLYNSMEQINSIAKQNNISEIVAITNIMAETFRYNLDEGEITTVGEDIDYAFNYFNVINLRRNNPINVIYNVPDDVLNCKSLKMIFQPILENIIKHAFKNNKDGTVEITGNSTGSYVFIDIKDDGAGIEAERLDVIKNMLLSGDKNIKYDGGIGLLNVHRRLRLYSDDEECGISIESKPDTGTVVRIKFRQK